MRKGYKYRGGIGQFDKDGQSILHRDIATLVSNQIYLPLKDELNDPAEGIFNDDSIYAFLHSHKAHSALVEKCYNDIIAKIRSMGIYSLAGNVSNELLWAHYASGHTGFAIEYDIDGLKKSLNFNKYFQKVFDLEMSYVDKVPTLTMMDLPPHGNLERILKKCIGTKSKVWKYEEEIRLAFDAHGLFDIDYRAITGIYFGYRMEESEIEYIMEQMKGRGLSYYKMELDKNSYRFTPVKIKDKFPEADKYVANVVDYNIDDLMICGMLSDDEKALHRESFIQAIESIKNDPNVESFYLVTVSYEDGIPLLKIFAYTIAGVPPVKSFQFRIDGNGAVYQVD
ncbi:MULTISPECIES: DUF2971 domain-containing protein [Bacteroidales]|jgi:hypothetical protein|uniref:DUF2971 domain-containing protein n=1 Tax=Bacteroidales TaxID=171549 RepID=UPI00244E293D|nr:MULTISPECIES: DUF2971 domain-containing protein [Bacteroidales]